MPDDVEHLDLQQRPFVIRTAEGEVSDLFLLSWIASQAWLISFHTKAVESGMLPPEAPCPALT